MNEQLKKDIAEWQIKADNLDTDYASFPEAQALVDEARTLLLRANMSL